VREDHGARPVRAHARVRPTRSIFEDRIPSGSLSGALPWLRASGAQLTTITGAPVILRGIGLAPADATAEPERITVIDAEDLGDLCERWRPRVVRIPINRARVLGDAMDWDHSDHLDALDELVAAAAGQGAYTLLSLERLDTWSVFGTIAGAPNVVAPRPEADAIGVWGVLADRYRDEPAVLFDLYSAPHAPLPDDLSGAAPTWMAWAAWVRMCIADIRRLHPRALAVISGMEWGTDVTGFPITGTEGAPIPNLVYGLHLRGACPPGQLAAMIALARSHPVLVTRWENDESAGTAADALATKLAAAGIGFIAGSHGSTPALERDLDGRLESTAFGRAVRRALVLDHQPRIAVSTITRTQSTNVQIGGVA